MKRDPFLAEGTEVLCYLDADKRERGTIVHVGRGNGTYRVRIGRRLHWVSISMVKRANAEAADA